MLNRQNVMPYKIAGKNWLTKKRILSHYIHNGPDSLSSLGRIMNLSIPTVTKLVGELLIDGYITDYGKQETHGGRRPNIYGIKPDSGYFVGVDIKLNSVYLLMLDFTGQVVNEMHQKALVQQESDAAIDALCVMIDSFIEMTAIDRSKLFSVGICVGSRVSVQTGETLSVFKNIEGPLRDVLSCKLGVDVIVDNDSRAMAYGEYMEGVVDGQRNVLFVNLNWGLGLGIILDGHLYYGSSGFAGEFGHIPAFDNEVICRCGKKGCLETEVSGLALHRRFIEQVQAGSSSALAQKVLKGENVDVSDIVRAALQEDVLAIELIGSIGSQLGKHIAGLIHLFNPELVIMGGALAEAGDYLMLPLQMSIKKYALNVASADTTILCSKLGERAGALGICMMARQKLFGVSTADAYMD